MKRAGRNRNEERIISRMRLGRTRLSGTRQNSEEREFQMLFRYLREIKALNRIDALKKSLKRVNIRVHTPSISWWR